MPGAARSEPFERSREQAVCCTGVEGIPMSMVHLVGSGTLTSSEELELRGLAGRACALYEGLMALPQDASEHRREVWSEIVEIQDRITMLIPPAR
jgi:hypothetical protein